VAAGYAVHAANERQGRYQSGPLFRFSQLGWTPAMARAVHAFLQPQRWLVTGLQSTHQPPGPEQRPDTQQLGPSL